MTRYRWHDAPQPLGRPARTVAKGQPVFTADAARRRDALVREADRTKIATIAQRAADFWAKQAGGTR